MHIIIYLFYLLLGMSGQLFAQSRTSDPSLRLNQTQWQMRVIELGPSREFFGTITSINFLSEKKVEYQRKLHAVRGSFEVQSPTQGRITLYNVSYPYRIQRDVLYYTVSGKEVALLRRLPDDIDMHIEDAPEAPAGSSQASIMQWLAQNSASPASDNTATPARDKDSLIGSSWLLLDKNQPVLSANLTRELNGKASGDIKLIFSQKNSIILDAALVAQGNVNYGTHRNTTIILSYTDTGWNRVMGKESLLRLDLRGADYQRNIYHLVSDDVRSIYPVTIRRMGDNEPSYAFINRTHIFSQLPVKAEEEPKP
jgi:hypothetical protein